MAGWDGDPARTADVAGGARRWRATRRPRGHQLNYTPGFMGFGSNARTVCSPEVLADLTEAQRAVLRPAG